MAPDTVVWVAQILNDWYMVRHYERGARMSRGSTLSLKRAQAIKKLGLTVREAFNRSDDFWPLLAAVADGRRPNENLP